MAAQVNEETTIETEWEREKQGERSVDEVFGRKIGVEDAPQQITSKQMKEHKINGVQNRSFLFRVHGLFEFCASFYSCVHFWVHTARSLVDVSAHTRDG